MRIKTWACGISIIGLFSLWFGIRGSLPDEVKAQSKGQAARVPQFKYDAYWPKPLPGGWVLGSVGSVCVDAHDHVVAVTRGMPELKENGLATPAPPVLEFDADGNVVNSWGNRDLMAKTQHGCFIDKDGNFWTAGNNDGIVQKYTHDGSKMLLQIGTRGVMDSADGTTNGKALNASHTSLFKPTQIAVDQGNGDVYVSDGYGNKRVVVFDKEGHYLRQWGRQATQAETDAGVGGVFLSPVHCVIFDKDGLVYVCDRLGDRIEVFDKMGNFKRSIRIESKTAHRTNSANAVGTAGSVAFSADPAQKFMYVANGADNVIYILDRVSGEVLSQFGRPGNQAGDLIDPHSIAVNSKGDIIIGEVPYGGKIQMWRFVSN
jgi:6-phosphogluconolactonase (cycloisomerase 2 family)